MSTWLKKANQIQLAAGQASHNGYRGICTTSDDCHNSFAILGGFAGKKCLSELPTCMWDWGDCSIVPCSEGQCIEFASGKNNAAYILHVKLKMVAATKSHIIYLLIHTAYFIAACSCSSVLLADPWWLLAL